MDNLTFVGERLDQHRAITLVRETEQRRRVLDQGVTVAPARPELTPLHTLGVWFRSRLRAARIGISY